MSRILPVEDLEVWGVVTAAWTVGLREKSWSFIVAYRVTFPGVFMFISCKREQK